MDISSNPQISKKEDEKVKRRKSECRWIEKNIELVANWLKEMYNPIKYVLKNKFKLACWLLFVFILGQGIIVIDLVDIFLNEGDIYEFYKYNIISNNLYSFSLACLGSNLFAFNSDILKAKIKYKNHKLWLNIIGIFLIFMMIAGANATSNDINTKHELFQIITYVISIVLNLYLLGIQLTEEEEEESIIEEDKKEIGETIAKKEIKQTDDKGNKL